MTNPNRKTADLLLRKGQQFLNYIVKDDGPRVVLAD